MGISVRYRDSDPSMGGWKGPGGGSDWGGGWASTPEGVGPTGQIYDVTTGDPISALMAGPIGYNPNIVAAGQPSVNTGNEFNMGVPRFAPSQWGSFDIPTLNPTIGFNNQPYVENFNAGFPTQMNPAFNIDNIQQPTAYNTMNAPYNIAPAWVNPNVNPWGSMFGGTGWTQQSGQDNN